ncbi:ESPR domain-containing protein [Achromobacter xylosoxidans]
MNKTHTVIWNASKACWTVASECARRRGKSGVSGARAVLAAVALAGLSALAPQALAAPTNGTVTHGSAFIWQDNPGNVATGPRTPLSARPRPRPSSTGTPSAWPPTNPSRSTIWIPAI